MKLALAALAAGAVLAASATSQATPTRWARARSEEVNRAEVTRAEAEAELIADRRERRSPFEDPIVRIESHALPADAMLALFSDGLSNQLRPAWARPLGDQAEQALQLFGDFSGTTDDATLLLFSPGQD